eukprot:scaffold5756_cov99-Cylindrotheca_fusiformis.AAC.7
MVRSRPSQCLERQLYAAQEEKILPLRIEHCVVPGTSNPPGSLSDSRNEMGRLCRSLMHFVQTPSCSLIANGL